MRTTGPALANALHRIMKGILLNGDLNQAGLRAVGCLRPELGPRSGSGSRDGHAILIPSVDCHTSMQAITRHCIAGYKGVGWLRCPPNQL